MGIPDRRGFWSGCLFLAIGGGALWLAPRPLGSLTAMGPGFFPTLLGAGLVGIGVLSMLGGVLSGRHVAVMALPWRPMAFILAGVVLAALLLTECGLAVALLCLVTASCYDRLRRRAWEAAAIYAVLLPLVWGIFVYGVQLPINLLW